MNPLFDTTEQVDRLEAITIREPVMQKALVESAGQPPAERLLRAMEAMAEELATLREALRMRTQ